MCSAIRRACGSSSCCATGSGRSARSRRSWGSTRAARRSTSPRCAGSASSSRGVRGRASTTASRTSRCSTCSKPAAGSSLGSSAEQQSILQRARALVIGALLVAALGAVAIGAVLALGRRAFEAGLVLQAAGAAGVGVAGFWALASRRHARRGVHELVRSALRRRRAERALPRHARPDRGAGARVLARATWSRPDAGARSAALTAAFVLALALVVCARDPLTFLTGWELMTLLSATVILVARGARQAVAADGLQLPRRHPSRRRRHLDRDPAARARRTRSAARLRSAPARGCRSRSRLRRSSGWGRRRA